MLAEHLQDSGESAKLRETEHASRAATSAETRRLRAALRKQCASTGTGSRRGSHSTRAFFARRWVAWRPSRAARCARRSTSPPVGGRGGGRGAAAAPPSASGSGSRPPTYPHILILPPPPFVVSSTTADSHLRSGRVERWAGILGLRWCLVLLNDSTEAVGSERAPGSPRSGPARGIGWRAGTTPSGRPRGDAAGASARR